MALLSARPALSAADLANANQAVLQPGARANPHDRIKAFCIDFNWGAGGPNGFPAPGTFAQADPAAHYRWYRDLGVNAIQTFCVSCNGYAWYQGSGVAPVQPGLKHDFLKQITELAHKDGVKVMGYFCVGANTYWGQKHPEQSYGIPSAIHIPFTSEYLDYLEGSIRDALTKTGIDGFMIDWAFSPPLLMDQETVRWLPCEQQMYAELFGRPFPGKDKLAVGETLDFQRRALERCWRRIHTAAKSVLPGCIIWLSCFDLAHPQVVGSAMLREVDWVMNETPTPAKLDATQRMVGPHTKLIQCVSGGSTEYDASKVLDDPKYQDVGLYGFAPWPDPATTFPPDPPRDATQKNIRSNIEKLRKVYRSSASAAGVANLRCEYLTDPSGIDAAKPRLSWEIESAQRGERQTRYQVLVASTPELLAQDQGDLWDSGEVASSQSIQVEYAGQALRSRTRCHWKVRVWDKDGKVSAWSQPARWTMGLLESTDWQAAWIKPAPVDPVKNGLEGSAWIWFPQAGALDQIPPGTAYFRARLQLPPGAGIRRASVVMCADNAFALFVNGKEVLKGDDWHAPQRTEITRMLKSGENIFAVAATNSTGNPSPAGLIGRVTVELANGGAVTLETGANWKSCAREQTGWREAGIDEQGWSAAQEVARFGAPPWGPMGKAEEKIIHPWLRRTFEVKSDIQRAAIYVNTPSEYELYINGRKVGDEVLAPAHVNVRKRMLYNVYDVAGYLRPGTNCIGLWMAPGWYQPRYGNPHQAPIVRAQLEVEAADGRMVVGTDAQWRATESCISQIGAWGWSDMGGELWDERRFVRDWNQVAFDDRGWPLAVEVPAPKAVHSWQALPGSRLRAPMAAKKIYAHKGKWVVDFGTTLTGWMRMRLPALRPGQQVTIEYADLDNPVLEHMPNGDGFQTFGQKDVYIAGGEGSGIFCSKFNQHAFRYAVIAGLLQEPALADAQAMTVETDLEKAGEFACSNELFNRIHQVTVATYHTQIPCGVLGGGEAREKLGYGDGGSFLSGMLYNLRSDAFFQKWLQDWCDGQRADGFLGHTAPEFYPAGGGPSWGGQASELARRLYLYYGDRRAIAGAYGTLTKYLQHLESQTSRDLLRYFNPYAPNVQQEWYFLGDWTPPGPSADQHGFVFETGEQREFFNNCYRVLLWDQLALFAEALGKRDEAQLCRERLAVLRPLIHQNFYDSEKRTYKVNQQAYLTLALYAQVTPPELRPEIRRQLEEAIVTQAKGHLATGLQGTFLMLDLLNRENRNDLVALMMNQTTFPGWGFLIQERKVTTWPETWSGWGSQIIQVVGTPGAWFYEGLAGIRPDPEGPGFKKILIKPAPVGGVTWVKAHHDSTHGRIVSHWQRDGNQWNLDLVIPANTTATVYVPASDAGSVTESGQPAARAEGVKFLRLENMAAVYAVGSGTYRFQSTIPETVK